MGEKYLVEWSIGRGGQSRKGPSHGLAHFSLGTLSNQIDTRLKSPDSYRAYLQSNKS
jgi:hypothetical protein